jgi:hypothetical protein
LHVVDQLPSAFGLAALNGELLFVKPADIAAERDESLANFDGQLAQSLVMALSQLRSNPRLEALISIAGGRRENGIGARRNHDGVHPYGKQTK